MMLSKRPMIIGITGGSGVGKGELCRILAARGIEIIDTDSLSHRAILHGNPAYDEILSEFGIEILGANNEIDRKKLGKIVFSDKQRLATLSKIVHKYVQHECEKIVAASSAKAIAIDAPALVEANMQDFCDIIIGVFADNDLRIARIMARDNITRDAAQSRINSQMPNEQLRGYIHYAIENNGNLQELEAKLSEITIL